MKQSDLIVKQVVTVEQAIKDLRELFELDKEGTKSIQTDKSFMITKTEYDRNTVLMMLQGYFFNKTLPDGWGCKIDAITLLWTGFEFIKF